MGPLRYKVRSIWDWPQTCKTMYLFALGKLPMGLPLGRARLCSIESSPGWLLVGFLPQPAGLPETLHLKAKQCALLFFFFSFLSLSLLFFEYASRDTHTSTWSLGLGPAPPPLGEARVNLHTDLGAAQLAQEAGPFSLNCWPLLLLTHWWLLLRVWWLVPHVCCPA